MVESTINNQNRRDPHNHMEMRYNKISVIQVPADGNPIIMLSDHGTIGGYPKIGVVISADYDKLVQLTPGTKIKFKECDLSSAESLFKLYELETQNLISQI